MKTHKHPHPGEAIKKLLERNKLNVTDAAEKLAVTRQALSNVINTKAGISPQMAVRLSVLFGGTIAKWIKLQATHDTREAEKELKKITKQIIPLKRQKRNKSSNKAA